MDKDRMAGSAKSVGGRVQEGAGSVVGDAQTQAEGRARQVEGELQNMYGQAKDAAAQAADVVRESAHDVQDYVRTTIEQRPYTAAAVALAMGYVLGRMGRRHHTYS